MINSIDRKHVTMIDHGEFATEASTLGLFPGEVWPSYIATTLGNKEPWRLSESLDDRAVYHQQGIGNQPSIRLEVVND